MLNEKRTIRSFVKRQGRMTPAQERALKNLWPIYGLSIRQGPINFKKIFNREVKTILEIGFGMGQSLIEMAVAEPETDFIGIEVHEPGAGAILNTIDILKLNNIRLYQEDAIDVLVECIPDKSLDIIQIFFPDPWPKKKHHKRRLIQIEFIHLLKTKLKLNGIIHLATDWENYAEHIEEIFSQIPEFKRIKETDAEYRLITKRPKTKFEERGKKLGHTIWDFIYKL